MRCGELGGLVHQHYAFVPDHSWLGGLAAAGLPEHYPPQRE